MNIASVGISCLGILIGILVAYYVEEAEEMNFKVLSSSIWILAGTSVIAIFRLIDPQSTTKDEYWFYPVGLLAGFALGTGIEWFWENWFGKWGPSRRHSKKPN